jgi:hypothetical protein
VDTWLFLGSSDSPFPHHNEVFLDDLILAETRRHFNSCRRIFGHRQEIPKVVDKKVVNNSFDAHCDGGKGNRKNGGVHIQWLRPVLKMALIFFGGKGFPSRKRIKKYLKFRLYVPSRWDISGILRKIEKKNQDDSDMSRETRHLDPPNASGSPNSRSAEGQEPFGYSYER